MNAFACDECGKTAVATALTPDEDRAIQDSLRPGEYAGGPGSTWAPREWVAIRLARSVRELGCFCSSDCVLRHLNRLIPNPVLTGQGGAL